MIGFELSPEVQQLVNDLLVWIGFGTVVGLVAKALMPGRDGGGPILTLLLGIGGTVLGCGCIGFFFKTGRIMPTSLLGMIAAVLGAFLLLTFYRSFADLFPWHQPDQRRDLSASHSSYDATRRRYSSALYED